MSRYINADELIMWIRKECLHNGTSIRIIDHLSSMQYCQNVQVPCGSCLRWQEEKDSITLGTRGLHKCRFLGLYTDKDFFCALGELNNKRKDDDK